MNYYLMKKDGKEYRFDTKAAVYEMWDCLGRGDVIIEHHLFDTDASGIMKEYIHTSRTIKRRKLKSGEFRYYLHFEGKCIVKEVTA